MPARLADLLRAPATADAEPAKVVPLPACRSGRQRRARWLVPASLAASVALLAALFWHGAPPPLVRTQDGQSFAAGALRRALDTQLASALAAGAETSVGLTFRDADGVVCRTFVHRAEPAMAGLACRRGDGWSLPVLVAPASERAGPIRQAASTLPPAVQAAINVRIRGDAFDAAEERAARETGWR